MKTFYTIHLFFFITYNLSAQVDRIPIRNGEQRIFASGINLAWGLDAEGGHNFALDLLELPDYTFPQALDELSAAGGNTLRWWLHSNGSYSPEFDNQGRVTGLDSRTIPNLQKVLDMAYERGIVISMCLWSFDMLQDQGQNQLHMKQLLEDSTYTRTYINHALIPILSAVGNHPAVLTWEIFNEPEGMTSEFGWTPVRTEMKYIQQFINLVAGAIHRYQPEALVSNGSWSFRASTDVGGNKNYYSDSLLVAAGGDSLGFLDFYQIHYFPEHFGNDLSPFHHPAAHWQLDKPVMIGEFPVTGIKGQVEPAKSTEEAYRYAYENGYAGCLSWSWTGFKGAGLEEARAGMISLWQNFPQDIVVLPAPDYNFGPKLVNSIPDVKLKIGETLIREWVDLKQIFYDEKDGSNLKYSIHSNTQSNIARAVISEQSKLDLVFFPSATGKTAISVRAEDSEGAYTIALFSVAVRDPRGNLALFKETIASTVENKKFKADQATDGDENTRWSSQYADQQWVFVDLEESRKFQMVRFYWEDAYASEYLIQIADDTSTWQTVYQHFMGDGEIDQILLDSAVTARYVRMYGLQRGTHWGFSLYEFQVYRDLITDVVDNFTAADFQVYPNPSTGIFNLNFSRYQNSVQLEVMDLHGKTMQKLYRNIFGNLSIDLSGHTEGVYLLKIQQEQQVVVKKIYLKN